MGLCKRWSKHTWSQRGFKWPLNATDTFLQRIGCLRDFYTQSDRLDPQVLWGWGIWPTQSENGSSFFHAKAIRHSEALLVAPTAFLKLPLQPCIRHQKQSPQWGTTALANLQMEDHRTASSTRHLGESSRNQGEYSLLRNSVTSLSLLWLQGRSWNRCTRSQAKELSLTLWKMINH